MTEPRARGVFRSTVGHPAVWIAATAWIGAIVAVLLLAKGHLPFDRPALAGQPFLNQVLFPTAGLIEVFILMAIVWAMTRKRQVDVATRAPERGVSLRETLMVLAYAAAGQAGGWFLGPALGYRPFSFHIAGTLFGCTTPPEVGEVLTWAAYNFAVFAAVPFLWFRRRYSPMQLNLRTTSWGGDVLLILVIVLVETVVELGAFPGLLAMDPAVLAKAAPLSFAIFFVGTVLPTMILIYCILIPRYLKLTGSPTVTVILGGLTYAAMHLVEGWSVFDSATDTTLSLIFVFLGYTGPGMFKTFVTLRTGNAWVHAIGYHAIAPHMVVDAPLMAKVFGLR